MKKKLSRLGLLAAMIMLLSVGTVGCKKVECDFCGEMKRCSTEEVLGEEVNICKDCEEDLEDLADALK